MGDVVRVAPVQVWVGCIEAEVGVLRRGASVSAARLGAAGGSSVGGKRVALHVERRVGPDAAFEERVLAETIVVRPGRQVTAVEVLQPRQARVDAHSLGDERDRVEHRLPFEGCAVQIAARIAVLARGDRRVPLEVVRRVVGVCAFEAFLQVAHAVAVAVAALGGCHHRVAQEDVVVVSGHGPSIRAYGRR